MRLVFLHQVEQMSGLEIGFIVKESLLDVILDDTFQACYRKIFGLTCQLLHADPAGVLLIFLERLIRIFLMQINRRYGIHAKWQPV